MGGCNLLPEPAIEEELEAVSGAGCSLLPEPVSEDELEALSAGDCSLLPEPGRDDGLVIDAVDSSPAQGRKAEWRRVNEIQAKETYKRGRAEPVRYMASKPTIVIAKLLCMGVICVVPTWRGRCEKE